MSDKSVDNAKGTAGSSNRRGGVASAFDVMAGPNPTGGLDLEDSRLVAYMLNPNHQVVWCNQAAREQLFGVASLHPSAEMRNIFLLLCSVQGEPQSELIQLHAGLAKPQLTRTNLLDALRIADEARAASTIDLFNAAETIEPRALLTVGYQQRTAPAGSPDSGETWRAMCAFFREGALFVHAPQALAEELFIDGIGDRASVMRRLASQQSPMLTPMAVMVADLQDSVRLCAELPPQSYFQLINEIWNLCNRVIQEFDGQIGKHAGDGIVAYFFPRPGTSYLDNCVRCAVRIKEEVRRLSHEWQMQRQWLNTLYLNTGLHEGQEWVGTFEIGDTFQLSALGDTINHSARLSEFATHGAIWASKQLVTRLESEVGTTLDYGVTHQQPDGRQHFVRSSFAQIQSLLAGTAAETSKARDIATMAVTEIHGLLRERA
jgi:class 3 adenylate cyclase